MTATRSALALLLLLVLPQGAAAGGSDPLVWIHAEANEGGASGGHAAFQVRDAVYHYQTIEGRTHLARWTWPRFRHLYNDLQNRTLHLVEQPVEPDTAGRIQRGLDAVYQRQHRQLARADDLALQRTLLEAWQPGGSRVLPVRALGLFDTSTQVDAPNRLALAIESKHGREFLATALRRVNERLAQTSLGEDDVRLDPPTEWHDAASGALAYRERLELREALLCLAHNRRVQRERQLDPREAPLSADERTWLSAQQQDLEERIVRLVASSRPDRGYALLLATARHRSVARSLAEDRHFTLDPFPRNALTIPAPERPARRRVFEAMAERLAAEHQAFRLELAGQEGHREPDLRALEVIAAAHDEVKRSLETGQPIRTLRAIESPARMGEASAPPPATLSRERARRLLAGARASERAYEAFLDREHGYELVRRNCATELLRSVQATFPSPDEAAAALGGRLSPEAGILFVPFGWIDAIERNFAATRHRTLPSYRVREVRAMQEREDSRWVSARESNTLTSALYVRTPADSHFLFFTDERTLLRPLLGAFNLAYGVAQSALGLTTLAFDRGERTERGLRGVVFSLPELAFVSLRKGTFEDAPGHPAQRRELSR